ncbi:hypothetical protein RHGRI_003904 [Rhododendron griersonianum]|uniref:Cytochrome P450 n=1 Tax=Rhododendron griersonianum TaxID=479676 RepID=A0AAV6L726_9ERIC|nr:hypothetical protein RHGRI_003904 [Rhododendron griersonianum]
MEFLSLILYLLLTITLLQILHSLLTRTTKTRSNLPPGPAPLPVVGNLLKLGDKPHKSLAELAKTHGPIMSLKLGRITTVVISSSALAKEVLQKQDLAFSTRSIPNALHAEEQYKYSVVWLPVSDRWRSLRKIMNSNIFSGNDLQTEYLHENLYISNDGSRLDANQNLRQQKVKELIAYAGKCCQDGVAVDIGSAAFTTSLNLLSNTVFSVDLAGLSQESAREFRDLATNITMEPGNPTWLIISLCLPRLTRKDLFVAGTDTTSSTIEWAMAELLHNPEILEKAKAELEQTIGKGKLIQESDISRLPLLAGNCERDNEDSPVGPILNPSQSRDGC